MMKRIWAAFLLSMTLALASAPASSIELLADKDSRYIVFMHTGPKKPDDESVRAIAAQVVRAGYLVRAPEADQDVVGGPGVDYFADEAKPEAERLADLANKLLNITDKNKQLKARRQTVKNPPKYLGLWLF